MSEEDKLAVVSRMLAEGKKDTAIAAAIGGTRHEARMLVARVREQEARQLVSVMPAGGALAVYEAACRALADARTLVQVLDVRDRAEALRQCAKVAKNRELEADAAEIRWRAERRLGQMLAMQKATTGLNPGAAGAPGPGRGRKNAVPEGNSVSVPTLAELDIGRKLSSRAQQLAEIPDKKFEADLGAWRQRIALENERVTLSLLRKIHDADRREKVRVEGGCRLSEWPMKQYEIILIDVPRRRNVYSDETGLHKAPDRHYRVMTFEELLDLPVPAIAAPSCMLLYWSTGSSLLDDIEIMAEWGFVALRPRGDDGRILRTDAMITAVDGHPVPSRPYEAMEARGAGRYSSHQIWRKQYPGEKQHGMGLRFWDVHEILLVGLRGKFPGPTPRGQQPLSVFDAPWRGHSVKPDDVADWVDRLHGDKTRIELFRRGPARPGWDVFGNEAEPVGAPVDSLAREHLHRALAAVARKHGDAAPRDIYLVDPELAPYFGRADAALGALSPAQFDLICDIDDPKACELAGGDPDLDIAVEILTSFATSVFPDAAKAAE